MQCVLCLKADWTLLIGVQALSATAPLIALWDDHEFANNVSFTGLQCIVPMTGCGWCSCQQAHINIAS